MVKNGWIVPKDRLDTRATEIGQAELDKEGNEQQDDPVPQQEEDVEGAVEAGEEVRAAGEVAPMDQGSPNPNIPREGPAPQHVDMSPRGASPKRRAGEDEMEDDSQDKLPRLRSPTISYRTDAESVDSRMDEGSLGGLNETDRKILSAAILGADVTEIYSPESRPSREGVRTCSRVIDGPDQRLGR